MENIKLLQGPPQFGWYKRWGLFEKDKLFATSFREVSPPKVEVYLNIPPEIAMDLFGSNEAGTELNFETFNEREPPYRQVLIWKDDYELEYDNTTWEERSCNRAQKYLETVHEIYQDQEIFRKCCSKSCECLEAFLWLTGQCEIRNLGTLQGIVERNGAGILDKIVKGHERPKLMKQAIVSILKG